jgi:DNA-binding transcriptional MocR family regulator
MGRTIKTSVSGTPPLRQAGGNNWPVTEREPHRRRAQTTGRDLERYAGLFAERTAVMRSSAMRDLMAITARPEVISLAGGLPDTSTFPPASFAALMTRIAEESSAEALQYGPTEGFGATVDCIIEVMRAEGMSPDPADVIVTTGGQQAIDLISKTLIDPGDPVICEAPTYPGAVPVFCSYQADVIQIACDEDGMRIDELESVLAELRAAGRRPKFIYSVPTFQNPAGVTSPSSAGTASSSWRERRKSSWLRTTPTACSDMAASRCRRSTSSTAATSSSMSARSRRSSPPGSGSAGRLRRRR